VKDKIVYVVCGCNGSGKTTFAKEYVSNYNLSFLNADEIEKEFNPDDVSGGRINAGREFYRRLGRLITQNQDFVIESTISGKVLLKYIDLLRSLNFKVVMLYLFLDNEEMAINRVKIRVKEGGHYIPDADILRRYSRSMNNFWSLYRYRVDEWQLFYNGDTYVVQTAIGKKNEFIIVNEEKYQEFLRGINVKNRDI